MPCCASGPQPHGFCARASALLIAASQRHGTGTGCSIDLKFDSRVDSTRSHLDLVMPDGKSKSLPASAPGDAELAAHATLAPGKYIIRWQALSTDGHITRGEIPFTVR